MRAHRYEKMTSIKKTNCDSLVGLKGERKAGRKKTTEMVDWPC